MDIFAVLYLCSVYLPPCTVLLTTWPTRYVTYVLLSDARFRRIEGLARIHHHHLSITLGIARHPFSLLLSSDFRVYYLFRGARLLLHSPSQYQCNHTYTSSNW